MGHNSAMREIPDVVLIGCVKSKRSRTCAATALYGSPLWHCRRSYAERSGVPWFILSAQYDLLSPETLVDPYDKTLASFAVSERRRWSGRVLRDLRAKFPDLSRRIVEVHAGKLYFAHGLAHGLRESGAIVRVPLGGLAGIGTQCRWYAEASNHTRKRERR